MCVLVKGEIRKVIPSKTKKGTQFKKLQVLVDFGRFERFLMISDFSGEHRELGAAEIPVIPDSWRSKTSENHGINYVCPSDKGA